MAVVAHLTHSSDAPRDGVLQRFTLMAQELPMEQEMLRVSHLAVCPAVNIESVNIAGDKRYSD